MEIWKQEGLSKYAFIYHGKKYGSGGFRTYNAAALAREKRREYIQLITFTPSS